MYWNEKEEALLQKNQALQKQYQVLASPGVEVTPRGSPPTRGPDPQVLQQLQHYKSETDRLSQELLKTQKSLDRLLRSKNEAEATASNTDDAAEMAELKRVNRELKDRLKKQEASLRASQVRIDRLEEETGQLKQKKQNLEEQMKDLRRSYEAKREELSSKIKGQDRQLQLLVEGHKKQLELIQNLKQQKLYLEACQVLKLTREELTLARQ